MAKQTFNENWSCKVKDGNEEAFFVTLPHDAMLCDKRGKESLSGVNSGWYIERDYVYQKKFFVPELWKEKKILIEFEGVYHNAEIWLNGKKAGTHKNGYIGFFIDTEKMLQYGKENEIRVIVKNSEQPNSRWYTGTGIYRPVWLHILPKKYILPEGGIRVTTLNADNHNVRVDVETMGAGEAKVSIWDKAVCIVEMKCRSNGNHHFAQLMLPECDLWSVENPRLYTCRVSFGEDVQETTFGIRTVECNTENGFCINGKRVILKGACVHHDNGILGACAYDFAEYRKVRLLKENGFNAIRSAHNPCSKALLRACDELGMLVVDEYTDMWYIHKTKYDYATEVEKCYSDDLEAIIKKDYNHPSVIMYSTGNEVSETAQKRGIDLCEKMTGYIHSIDDTRPVTCGVNIFFNFLSSMGLGVYSDKKAEKESTKEKKKAVGSEFFNKIAGIFGSGFMKWGATLYPCDLKTKDAFSKMDVAGYNYGILRYRHDLKKYPYRLILGSETFCSDAYRFWKLAEKNNRIIGDFVWAGIDYLGEVGLGAWEYKEYAPRFDKGPGWISAGAGCLDLTGKAQSQMAYMRVAYGTDSLRMAVIPVNNTKNKHSSAAWRMTNAIESWSWEGCEGKDAVVEVYARAKSVKLYLNDQCIGEKKVKKDCKVKFSVKYEKGILKAVSFGENGRKIAETQLETAGKETILRIEPECTIVRKESDLCYVRLKYTDAKGIWKPLARGKIRLSAEGGKILGVGSACPYYDESYLSDVTDTYYGEALAVIKPQDADVLFIKAESRYGIAEEKIKIERNQ